MDAAPRVLTEPTPPGERIVDGPGPFWERLDVSDAPVVWFHGGPRKPEYDLARTRQISPLSREGPLLVQPEELV